MQFVFYLLMLITLVKSEKALFWLQVQFNDKDVFQEFSIGSPSTYRRPDECAQQCARNPQCTVFSFNQVGKSCQLHGDGVDPDVSPVSEQPAARYYAYETGWCPLKRNWILFRAVKMCLKFSKGARTYNDARLKCDLFNARLVVLEDEKKAAAVINGLQRFGWNKSSFFLGQHVWSDSHLSMRNTSELAGQNTTEKDCGCLYKGDLYNFPCESEHRFICERIN